MSPEERKRKGRRHRARYKGDRRYETRWLAASLVCRSVKAIQSKGGVARDRKALCGWTVEEFAQHLESRFEPGMSWENHGDWHVDHDVPVSWYLEHGVYDLAIINALSNLRPMWAKQNIAKHNSMGHLGPLFEAARCKRA